MRNKNRVGISFYPKTTKKNKWVGRNDDISGTCEVTEDDLIFTFKLLALIRLKKLDFNLELKNIAKIESLTINLILPIGVCITMEDGKEYIFGCMRRKKLLEMILDAKDNIK